MELVKNKVFILFAVLVLGVTIISSLNNNRMNHQNSYSVEVTN